MKKGQAVNIDWTVALGLFLITSLTAVIFLTNVDTSPDRISTLEAKNIEIQENLINETSVEGKKIPLIVRGPHKISNIPIDRHYNFPSKAFTESGGGDIPAELDISNNSVVAITDSGNLTHSLAYFQENVSNASYTNDITTESDQINNSKISLRTGGSGINSLKINGQELLNPDADLGSGDSSITEHGIYAETRSSDLRAYNNSSELILDDRTENVTFNLESLDTLYWYENDTAISLTGTGVKAEGKTKGFTVASNHGITFVGDMDATISKPDESTVKAEIDAERIRIRLHDSDYSAGKDRIRFYDKGYIVLGASKKFSAPYRSKIKQLNSVSQSDFEESLNTETFNYNIGLGSWIQKLVDQVSDWNQEGEFNATSASRKDNSGNLGLGYRNGTPDDSLVGYWRMDRNVAGDGGTVKDYSGYGNDGTTQNNVNTGVQGVFGSSASEFRDDAITGPEDPSLQYNNHTLSFWIKQTSSLDSEYNLIIGLGDGSTNDDGTGGRLPYVYYHSDGSGSLHWRWSTATRGNDGLNTPADTITQNGWIHLTGVKKGKNYSIYKNGELLDSQELSSADAGTGYGGFKFRGDSRNNVTFKLDEIRLYNRKFTSKKIKDLYKYGKDGTFEGDYAVENQTGSFQRWEKLTVDAVIPSETSLEVVFESLDENGNVVDNQNIQLQTGEKSYNINSESSRGYRLTFQGNSSNPEKSWEVKDYNLKYGPELQRGSTIPLYTSAVVSDISSALIHRNGTFSEINNRVVVWP